MILIDSSAWIEYFRKGALHRKVSLYLSENEDILVPTLVLFEVYRKIHKSLSENEALSAVASLSSFQVIELTREIALLGADLSLEHQLGMADSCVLATAQIYHTPLITLDYDFSQIPGVKILKK